MNYISLLNALVFSFLVTFSPKKNDTNISNDVLIDETTATQSQNEELVPRPINIIPKPTQVKSNTGVFTINRKTTFVVPIGAMEVETAVNYLNEKIKHVTGNALMVNANLQSKNAILIELTPEVTNKEGYELAVTPSLVTIKAQTAQGVFYAMQSIRQLLPIEIEKTEKNTNLKLEIPCCEIIDAPRYAWRGLHLDVCRHFFDVDFVKKYIDLMAMHKYNRFHWHLTEDQGWRIEIKKYPKLTTVAAFRKETLIGGYEDKPHRFDGKPYGGFYTQDQVKEIVKYAQDRFVTVVPEIEMPGHSLAALAAYPELACTKGPFEVGTKWGVFDDVYAPKEETFVFLENVLTEVMELFPSEYIHIGGDECPKKRWKESEFCQNLMKKEGLKDENELQSYFIRRMEKFINAKGRKLIGWDEILEGGLSDNATVMSWRGVEGGIAAAKMRHDAVMSPGSHCYFDHYQSKDRKKEPLSIGGFTDLKKVYSYEPTPAELNEEEAKHILGAQANVWTEYITTSKQVEYMAYPRAIALSEVVWSPKDNKNFEDFEQRLQFIFKRLQILNVNYAKHFEKK
jgi:hexosaminidase